MKKVEFAGNGIMFSVAMFIQCPAESRDELDQMVMSLPLAAALAATKLTVDGESLHVELVPELYEPEDEPNRAEMLEQTCSIIKDAWFAVYGGNVDQVFFSATTIVPPESMQSAELREQLALPSRRLLNAEGGVL